MKALLLMKVRLLIVLCITVLTACGGGSGGNSRDTLNTNLPDSPANSISAPTLSFSTEDASVTRGSSVLLRWNATDVARCSSSASPSHQDWQDDALQDFTNDGHNITSLQSDTTFTLTCRGLDESLISESLFVEAAPTPQAVAAPTLSFTAQNTRVTEGGRTQLSWSATDVVRCRSTATPSHPDWEDNRLQELASAGFDIANLQRETTFTLTCRGTDNSLVTASLMIVVDPLSAPVPAPPPEPPPTPTPAPAPELTPAPEREPEPTAPSTANSIAFNETTAFDDLDGSLRADVYFGQSQLIPAGSIVNSRQPHLVANRKTLLLVKPQSTNQLREMTATIRAANGQQVSTISLNAPSNLPATSYAVDTNVDVDSVDFSPLPGSTFSLNTREQVLMLADTSNPFLAQTLRNNAAIQITFVNGRHTRQMHLPIDDDFENKVVTINVLAQRSTDVFYREDRSHTISQGEAVTFKFVSGEWVFENMLVNNDLVYAQNTWSGELPAEIIQPGMSITVNYGTESGTLDDIEVGGRSQLIIHTIDVGMLVEPRGEFLFPHDDEAHREYFQTAPVSSLVISQYEPVHFREVVMPDGTRLTTFSPDEGSVHGGDMREAIGKQLISHGINNANYGLHTTPGLNARSHPYTTAQITAHTARGRYSNGVQVHGLSGGNGMATLLQGYGNEFSHEIGHNYGLGHFVDGFAGSLHRRSDEPNSTWGWDADKMRLLPNFSPAITNQDRCVPEAFSGTGAEACQAPYLGRRFGADAMAGGAPLSGFNRYTLYTPNSARLIQAFFESKAVFDASSGTGFVKWNANTRQMEPYTNTISVLDSVTPNPRSGLTEPVLRTLFQTNDLIEIVLADGSWTREITVPAASAENAEKILTIQTSAGFSSNLTINRSTATISRGFTSAYRSNGSLWQALSTEALQALARAPRSPTRFGIPVTTLVGYYDPENVLPSYIYPAMHGAYGFTYADDSTEIASGDCQLQVSTDSGMLSFRLANSRISEGVMNKFHVNVPEDSNPSSAVVRCDNNNLAQSAVTPVAENLGYTVNGS